MFLLLNFEKFVQKISFFGTKVGKISNDGFDKNDKIAGR